MAFPTLMLRLVLDKIRGNGSNPWVGSMRLLVDHVLVTERVQAVNGVEIVNEILMVDL
jgi:hypothetical protein